MRSIKERSLYELGVSVDWAEGPPTMTRLLYEARVLKHSSAWVTSKQMSINIQVNLVVKGTQ